eukprot:4400389-Heterocapsa_arctica.AAC.1
MRRPSSPTFASMLDGGTGRSRAHERCSARYVEAFASPRSTRLDKPEMSTLDSLVLCMSPSTLAASRERL